MSLVVVLGATGQQGGGIVDALLKSPDTWKVRAVTRDPSGEKGKALAARGAEVVSADVTKPETLAKAFEGATAVFALTAYWEFVYTLGRDGAGEAEVEQLKAMAKAAAAIPTLKHYIVSGLPPAKKISAGKYSVPHFDYKDVATVWVKENLPDLYKKTTIIWPGWYGNNLLTFPAFRFLRYPDPLGSYVFALSAKRESILPVVGEIRIAIGTAVAAILRAGERTHGKIVPILTESIPCEDVARIFTRVTGKPCAYAELTDEGACSAWGDIAGAEMTSQLRWSEDYPDWFSFYPEQTLRLSDIGVDESKLIGLEAYMKSVADQIV